MKPGKQFHLQDCKLKQTEILAFPFPSPGPIAPQ